MVKKGLEARYDEKQKYLQKIYEKRIILADANHKKKIDKWYKKSLILLNKRYRESIIRDIHFSALKLKFRRMNIALIKKRNLFFEWADRYSTFFMFIPNIIVSLIYFVSSLVSKIIFIFMIPYSIIFKVHIKKADSNIEAPIISNNLNKVLEQLKILLRLPIYKLSSDYQYIDVEKNINDALKILVKGSKFVYVKQNQEIIGFIGPDEILNLDITSDVLMTPAKDAMKQIRKVDKFSTFGSIIESMIANNERTLVVGIKPPYKVIQTIDLLTELNNFYESFSIQTIYLKKVKDIIPKDLISIGKNEKVYSARTLMVKNEISIVGVKNVSDFIGKYHGKNEVITSNIVGIFSLQNYCNELSKGVDRIRKTSIEYVMEPNFPKMNSYENLFQANQKIIEKGKQLVYANEKPIGVITEHGLLKALYEFIISMKQKN